MSIYNDIRSALETKLSNIAGIPTVAYENVSFSPTTGTPYINLRFVPVLRQPAVRGLNPQQLYNGFLNVYCYAPEGNGPRAAEDIAEKVLDAFEATTDISYTNPQNETIIVSIEYAERGMGVLDSPWYSIPVDIGWYIYAS